MDLLKVGQKLSIYFFKDANLVEIVTTILEVLDDRLNLELPPYFMRYIEYLEVGNEITVRVFSKVGTLDFNSIIISSPLEESFSIELDYNAIKLTEAENMPVISDVESINIKFNNTEINAKTFEIATEHIKVYCDKKIEIGTEVDCILSLPKDYGTISFRATLKEIDPVYDNEYTFSDFCMTEDDRQKILYYIYLYANNTDWKEE